MRETALIGWSQDSQDSQDSLLNKMFSLHADKGMSDFNAVKERLKTGNVNTSHEQISDDELERMFSRCQKVLEHIPERHLSICKKCFPCTGKKKFLKKLIN